MWPAGKGTEPTDSIGDTYLYNKRIIVSIAVHGSLLNEKEKVIYIEIEKNGT